MFVLCHQLYPEGPEGPVHEGKVIQEHICCE